MTGRWSKFSIQNVKLPIENLPLRHRPPALSHAFRVRGGSVPAASVSDLCDSWFTWWPRNLYEAEGPERR